MRRKFLLGVGLLAFAAACTGSAIAADIAARPIGAPPPMVPPPIVPEWAGFYIGINGGGGWARRDFEGEEFDNFSTFSGSAPPSGRASGGVFGFQAGHNWQWGPVVGGLEIDFDGANIKDTSTFFFTGFPNDTLTREAKLDELASVRARLGYLIFPNWLLYGTVGLGWGHFRVDATDTFVTRTTTDIVSTSNFANEFGWVVGAGVEWQFIPHWLLRGEWLHYDFGRDTIVGAAVLPETVGLGNFNVRTTVDVARAALSYKF
jgi:outer membrane immunogenic protein